MENCIFWEEADPTPRLGAGWDGARWRDGRNVEAAKNATIDPNFKIRDLVNVSFAQNTTRTPLGLTRIMLFLSGGGGV